MNANLPLARYRFTIVMQEPLRLPHYAGSLLRGQFGAALRRTTCMTGASRCEPCPLLATCPYPAIFENPATTEHDWQKFSHVPNPYVVEPPTVGQRQYEAGDTLQFSVVLLGRSLQQLPLVIHAFNRMFHRGLGRERARGTLTQIEWLPAPDTDKAQGQMIWHADAPQIEPHQPQWQPRYNHSSDITLQILTPMRLQKQGRPLDAHTLTPRKLVADLLRRIHLLFAFHHSHSPVDGLASDLVAHAQTLEHQPHLKWHDWSRYSSRQQQSMTLGGVLGDWQLSGDTSPLMPWLELGQWLHVGKNATMGMGRYRLVEASHP